MQHQMPQGEIFKSVTLTGKERRAYFNFSKHSLLAGFVTLTRFLDRGQAVVPKERRNQVHCLAAPQHWGSFIVSPARDPGACKLPSTESKCFLGDEGELKGRSSVSISGGHVAGYKRVTSPSH